MYASCCKTRGCWSAECLVRILCYLSINLFPLPPPSLFPSPPLLRSSSPRRILYFTAGRYQKFDLNVQSQIVELLIDDSKVHFIEYDYIHILPSFFPSLSFPLFPSLFLSLSPSFIPSYTLFKKGGKN
jgi:hypothetical protein